MARTVIATDNFNRAGPALGANWGDLHPDGSPALINASIQVVPGSAYQGGSVHRWVGAGTFTNDQYSSIRLTTLFYNDIAFYTGVLVRAGAGTDASRNYYLGYVASDGASTYTTALYKMVNGTSTLLYSAINAWANGDYLSLEAEGTTLRLCKNGTPLGGSFTQTNQTDLTTGLPGFNLSGGSAQPIADDWEGGSLPPPPGFSLELFRRSRSRDRESRIIRR